MVSVGPVNTCRFRFEILENCLQLRVFETDLTEMVLRGREMVLRGMYWTAVPEHRYKLMSIVTTAMNIWFPQEAGNFVTK